MKFVIVILCSCLCVCSAFSQEDKATAVLKWETTDSPASQSNSIPYAQQLWFNALTDQIKGFPADDGHYLAQNELELQTYYDLGLAYRYFEDPLLRAQLGLPTGQGIMIKGVNAEGQGARVGFQAGDIVLTVDEVPVDTQYKFVIGLSKNRGQSCSVTLRRSGKIKSLDVSLPEAVIDENDQQRLIIGVTVEPISDAMKAQLQTDGVLITGLTEKGPSLKAGLKVNDLIIRIDGVQLADLDDLKKAVQNSKGNSVTVDYMRAGKSLSVELRPIEASPEPETGLWLSTAPLVRYQFEHSLVVDPRVTPDIHQTIPVQIWWAEKPDANSAEPESKETRIDRILGHLKALEQELNELKSNLEK